MSKLECERIRWVHFVIRISFVIRHRPPAPHFPLTALGTASIVAAPVFT
jgi:hypothetical protein